MIDDNGVANLGHRHDNNVAVQRCEDDKNLCNDCVYKAYDSSCNSPVDGCDEHEYIWIKYKPIKK